MTLDFVGKITYCGSCASQHWPVWVCRPSWCCARTYANRCARWRRTICQRSSTHGLDDPSEKKIMDRQSLANLCGMTNLKVPLTTVLKLLISPSPYVFTHGKLSLFVIPSNWSAAPSGRARSGRYLRSKSFEDVSTF